MPTNATTFTNGLDHPVDLADGRVLAPEDTVTLTKSELGEDHNKNLISDESLVEGRPPEQTVQDILDEVGDDVAKALVAKQAEEERDKPRSSLLDGLDRILDNTEKKQ